MYLQLKPLVQVALWLCVIGSTGSASGQALPDPQRELVAPTTFSESMRVWKDATGKHQTRAQFVNAAGGKVQLRRQQDEKLVVVEIDRLSKADQVHVQQLTEPRIDAASRVILGKVVRIVDGDLLRVANSLINVKTVRLDRVDAPEKGQPYNRQAKNLLEKLVGTEVRVEYRSEDRYERVVGMVYSENRWLNFEIVAEGLAWHAQGKETEPHDPNATPLNSPSTTEASESAIVDGLLEQAQKHAQSEKLNIWSKEQPIAPWEWQQRLAMSKNQNGRQQIAFVFVTPTGKHYHNAGCRHVGASSIRIPITRAAGYQACKHCNPPR